MLAVCVAATNWLPLLKSRQHVALTGMLVLLLVITGCSSRSAPAPVTTLELRENFYQQRNRGSLGLSRYTVRRGDTLYAIAFRAGKDVREVARLNNLHSPYIIYPGQVLRLTVDRSYANKSTAVVEKSSNNAQKKPNLNAARTKTADPSQVKSNSSVKSVKPVAPKNQTGYVQSTPKKAQKTANASSAATAAVSSSTTLSSAVVQWQWPVKGRVISAFSHQQQGNKGIDIAGTDGAKVFAAASGQVVYAGNALRGYGNLIIIKHNDDYLSAYAHNRKLLVTDKQQVIAGQQIAEMGSSDATDTRLHFEIRFRGTSVDPLKYLPK